MYFYV
jgi:hypothetical protein